MSEIQIVDEPERDRYEARAGGRIAGFAEYRRVGDRLSVLHTEVAAEFEGRGIGSVVVRGVLADARARGLAVLPFCPFVRSYLTRHPEDLDLVPAADRPRFELPGTGEPAPTSRRSGRGYPP